MAYYLTLDGKEYRNLHIVPPIKRSFQILDGENAGRLAVSGEMVRDIIGTFYNYSLSINKDKSHLDEYDEFYEEITDPNVDSHELIVPYGQGMLTFRAYVTNGADELTRIDANGNKWTGLQINFIAMKPQRTPQ